MPHRQGGDYGVRLLPCTTSTTNLVAGRDLTYAAAWRDQLGTIAEQNRALRIHTALFCADFSSEVGHVFNDQAASVDFEWVRRVEDVMQDQLRAP